MFKADQFLGSAHVLCLWCCFTSFSTLLSNDEMLKFCLVLVAIVYGEDIAFRASDQSDPSLSFPPE